MADLNNSVVLIVSASLIFKSFRDLVSVASAPVTTGITVIYMVHSFFNSLARARYLSLFLPSFSFILWSAVWQILLFGRFFFLLSGRNWMIYLYLKISNNFVRLIFQDRFRVVHIQFLLAQFPGDHPSHLVVSTLILSWC